MAERVQVQNLDYLMRIHRATDDPCEAERSNAEAGEAIADGRPLKLDVDFVYDAGKAWRLCEQVPERIHNAAGPHGYMTAHVTEKN